METLIQWIKSFKKFSDALIKLFGGETGGLLDVVIKKFPEAYDKCMGVSYNGTKIIPALENIIIPIAMCLLLLYFLVDLLSQTAAVNFTTETFIRSFGKFIVGFALLNNIYVLSDYIVQFSEALIYTGDTTKTLSSGNYGPIASAVNTSAIFASNKTMMMLDFLMSGNAGSVLSFNQLVNILIKTMFQVLIYATASVLCIWMAYRRAFLLVINTIFLPITITDVYGNQLYSSAIRHVKKIFSLAMQYPLIYIICAVGLELIETTPTATGNWIAYIGQLFMVTLAIWKAIKNSKSEIDNMFG